MKTVIAGLAGVLLLTPFGGTARAQEIPDEARKPLVEVLGSQFVVYRDKAQDELKLSDERKKKLFENLPEFVQETADLHEKVKDLEPAEREKRMQEHRRKCDEKLSALVNDVLDARQRDRLFQVQLQCAGVFALLGEHPLFQKLKITKRQRERFVEVVQAMQRKIEPLAKEAQAGGNPEEIRAKVMQIRKEHQQKIEALLSDAQKKQWKELLGSPLALDD